VALNSTVYNSYKDCEKRLISGDRFPCVVLPCGALSALYSILRTMPIFLWVCVHSSAKSMGERRKEEVLAGLVDSLRRFYEACGVFQGCQIMPSKRGSIARVRDEVMMYYEAIKVPGGICLTPQVPATPSCQMSGNRLHKWLRCARKSWCTWEIVKVPGGNGILDEKGKEIV
jgi:hypothetical protein